MLVPSSFKAVKQTTYEILHYNAVALGVTKFKSKVMEFDTPQIMGGIRFLFLYFA